MNNSILSVTFSFAIFLNATATFAGQWTEVPGGAAPHPSALNGIAAVSANDIWAVGSWGQNGGQGLIEHWDGTNWSVATVLPFGTLLFGVAAHSSRDVWAVGSIVVPGGQRQTLVEHWNGRRWVAVSSPSLGTYDRLSSVCIISRNDAWAVGSSLTLGTGDVYILMHWDGTSWSLVNGHLANSSGLGSVKAFATDNVWAVGSKDFDYNQNTSSTFTLHWDGTAWSEVPSPNVDEFSGLSGVDGATLNDVWAVGSSNLGSLAIHWDGAAWTAVPTTTEGSFTAVKVFSTTNVWAVGDLGNQPFSARWDGTQWRVIPTPPVDPWSALWSISGRDGAIWAVGNGNHGGAETDLIFNWTR